MDNEEKAVIRELKQEKEQKLQNMKDKIKKINDDISSLTNAIKDLEQTLDSRDIRFLKVSIEDSYVFRFLHHF